MHSTSVAVQAQRFRVSTFVSYPATVSLSGDRNANTVQQGVTMASIASLPAGMDKKQWHTLSDADHFDSQFCSRAVRCNCQI